MMIEANVLSTMGLISIYKAEDIGCAIGCSEPLEGPDMPSFGKSVTGARIGTLMAGAAGEATSGEPYAGRRMGWGVATGPDPIVCPSAQAAGAFIGLVCTAPTAPIPTTKAIPASRMKILMSLPTL